jgi:hypothetical protein
MSHPDTRTARLTLACLLKGSLVVAVALLAYYLWLVRGTLLSQPPSKPDESDARFPHPKARFTVDEDGRVYPRSHLPGIATPPIRSAADADIADSDEVIGVCIGKRARAYRIDALAYPRHVINDLIDGRAVSVTYCDRAQCARVFTDKSAKAPLQLDIAGQRMDGLILQIGDIEYDQKTGRNLTSPKGASLPYKDSVFVRTTWRKWREAHPDTDIYVGDRRSQ